jgi:hypothetical protein
MRIAACTAAEPSHPQSASGRHLSKRAMRCCSQSQKSTRVPWLLGHHFNLHSDHRNVLSLWTPQAPKVQRWRCKLSEYDFTIHHIPGVENKIPDALSRLHGEHNIYRICAQTRSSSIAINPELAASILQCHSPLTGACWSA